MFADGSPPTAAVEEPVRSVRTQKQSLAEAQAAGRLYADRVRVYPRSIAGKFRKLKWRLLGAWLLVYYALPWIRWPRGPNAPDQAVLLDLENRRGYFFFIEIWPEEVFYLTGLLVLAAVGLFLATSLAGRVWCGYACPQTVWTDLFMWIERRIEGDRNARMALDRAPFAAGKAARKAAKHAAWLLVSFLTGGAWIMYFADAPTLASQFFRGEAGSYAYFFVGLFTATTYLLAGWAREQVCTYMCPWPRFQSAMFDEDTLIVTYQKWRGEPRTKIGPGGKKAAGAGDCVDCGLCVAVCPVGIDIRDGTQLECISCALCVDACNGVMRRFGLPVHLITYTTERRLAARAGGARLGYRLLRPRTLLYAMLFAGVGIVMLAGLVLRSDAAINVLHERNPLFVSLSDGSVRNTYTIKLLNKEREPREFRLGIAGIEAAEIRIVGLPAGTLGLAAAPDTVTTYIVHVTVRAGALKAEQTDIEFSIADRASTTTALRRSRFYGPRP
jgi:cytochrome c oxidase accessory protein FixG